MSKVFPHIVAAVVAAATISAALPNEARADGSFNGCQISQVGLDLNGGGPRLKVWCSNDGNIYYTNPGGTCSATNLDMVKLWQSMLMSALLSGKRVNFYFQNNSSCNVRNILNVDVAN